MAVQRLIFRSTFTMSSCSFRLPSQSPLDRFREPARLAFHRHHIAGLYGGTRRLSIQISQFIWVNGQIVKLRYITQAMHQLVLCGADLYGRGAVVDPSTNSKATDSGGCGSCDDAIFRARIRMPARPICCAGIIIVLNGMAMMFVAL